MAGAGTDSPPCPVNPHDHDVGQRRLGSRPRPDPRVSTVGATTPIRIKIPRRMPETRRSRSRSNVTRAVIRKHQLARSGRHRFALLRGWRWADRGTIWHRYHVVGHAGTAPELGCPWPPTAHATWTASRGSPALHRARWWWLQRDSNPRFGLERAGAYSTPLGQDTGYTPRHRPVTLPRLCPNYWSPSVANGRDAGGWTARKSPDSWRWCPMGSDTRAPVREQHPSVGSSILPPVHFFCPHTTGTSGTHCSAHSRRSPARALTDFLTNGTTTPAERRPGTA